VQIYLTLCYIKLIIEVNKKEGGCFSRNFSCGQAEGRWEKSHFKDMLLSPPSFPRFYVGNVRDIGFATRGNQIFSLKYGKRVTPSAGLREPLLLAYRSKLGSRLDGRHCKG
jgi:hypothetical protein